MIWYIFLRLVGVCNTLAEDVAEAGTVTTFNKLLDRYLNEEGVWIWN